MDSLWNGRWRGLTLKIERRRVRDGGGPTLRVLAPEAAGGMRYLGARVLVAIKDLIWAFGDDLLDCCIALRLHWGHYDAILPFDRE